MNARPLLVAVVVLAAGCAGNARPPTSATGVAGTSAGSVTSGAIPPSGSASTSVSRSPTSRASSATRSPTSSSSRPSGSSTSASETLAAQLDAIAREAASRYGGTAGVAVAAPGAAPVSGGTWATGPAWSTAKVPVAVAAIAQDPGDQRLRDLASAAIRLSDNASAEALWASLGDPQAAGAQTQAVVRGLGDRHTVVQWERIRPPFTAFGQTQWALTDQAVAAAGLPCLASAAPVLDLMGRIDPSQAFGLGHVPGARFKGGWGPDPSGRYLTRQFGVIGAGSGHVGVAIAAQPAAGSFEAGQGALSLMAERLAGVGGLPGSACAR